MKGQLSPFFDSPIDTSGAAPIVAACRTAIADSVAWSNAIRAMPAALEIDTLHVPANGEVTIDATGGGIVRVRSLSFERVRGRVSGGENLGCIDAEKYGGELYITGTPSDWLVLDVVDSLRLGACSIIEAAAEQLLINIAGPGKAIRIPPDVTGYPDLSILAPERTIKVDGAREEGSNVATFLWGRKIAIRGFLETERPICP